MLVCEQSDLGSGYFTIQHLRFDILKEITRWEKRFKKFVRKFCYQNSVTKIMLANSVMHSNEGIQGTLHMAKRDEGAESHLSFFPNRSRTCIWKRF